MADGTEFGPYLLQSVLGRGGMGEVFRAVDRKRSRTVAVKRLLPSHSADPDFRERFRRESQLVARLSSPHVVPIHDFGEIDGRLFLDMRLVDGDDLGVVLERAGRLSPVRAVEIATQVASALDSAHRSGLVHRDVKPSNVMLVEDADRDFAYLMDFGIVRDLEPGRSITATGGVLGTPTYLPPEVISGLRAAPTADVYSLSCMLFELMAGTPPFTGPDVLRRHLLDDPPRLSDRCPEAPAGLDAVLARGLAKDPAARFPGAGGLCAAARAALTARPGSTTVSPTRSVPAAPVPRGPAAPRRPLPPPSGAPRFSVSSDRTARPVRRARGRVFGIGLAVIVLGFAVTATGTGLGWFESCTLVVQAAQVTVRSAPGTSGAAIGTLTRGTEVIGEKTVDSGYRKLTGGDRWIPANTVAATSGSRC